MSEARISGPPQSSSMAISGGGAPHPLWDWGQSLFQWPACLQARHGLGEGSGVLPGTLGPSGQLACICSIPPCWSYLQMDSWTFLAPLGCPEVTRHGRQQWLSVVHEPWPVFSPAFPLELGLNYWILQGPLPGVEAWKSVGQILTFEVSTY